MPATSRLFLIVPRIFKTEQERLTKENMFVQRLLWGVLAINITAAAFGLSAAAVLPDVVFWSAPATVLASLGIILSTPVFHRYRVIRIRLRYHIFARLENLCNEEARVLDLLTARTNVSLTPFEIGRLIHLAGCYLVAVMELLVFLNKETHKIAFHLALTIKAGPFDAWGCNSLAAELVSSKIVSALSGEVWECLHALETFQPSAGCREDPASGSPA